MVRHGTPRVVLGRGLWKPDVAGVGRELSAFQRAYDGVTVANLAASRVHDIAAALHHTDQLVVEHALGLGMERRVDGDHIADLHQRLYFRMESALPQVPGRVELVLGVPPLT